MRSLSTPQLRAEAHSWIDRALQGQQIEDDLVEVKGELPEPEKAARQIGGLANKALGDPAYLVLGVDESAKKLVGVEQDIAASWLDRLWQRFGDAPSVDRMLSLPRETTQGSPVSVCIVELDTTDGPFTIRHEGDVFEVPIRDGTRTRSCRRDDLVRLLLPRSRAPTVEFRGASISLAYTERRATVEAMRLDGRITVFVGSPKQGQEAFLADADQLIELRWETSGGRLSERLRSTSAPVRSTVPGACAARAGGVAFTGPCLIPVQLTQLGPAMTGDEPDRTVTEDYLQSLTNLELVVSLNFLDSRLPRVIRVPLGRLADAERTNESAVRMLYTWKVESSR